MSNGAKAAYPLDPQIERQVGVDGWGSAGLTKRELFAAMAMQGISSNTELCDQTRGTVQQVAEWAVAQADALLAQLEKSP